MIVRPTVNELLKHAENRFALVIATSKRARQIANGDEKLTNIDEKSPVTLAANEIAENKIRICTKNELEEINRAKQLEIEKNESEVEENTEK